MADVRLEPGLLTTRAEISRAFGGSPQGGGIVTSRTRNVVLVYTDPAAGEQHGYFDGWLRDGGHGPIFEYTGHGKYGDQTFTGPAGSGNRMLLQRGARGAEIHVFKAVGYIVNTRIREHRYIGCFTLDADEPYMVRQAPDKNGSARRVIVFRLRPDGPYELLDDDVIPPASRTVAASVPADLPTSLLIEPEANSTLTGTRSGTTPMPTTRREATLSEEFQAFMSRKRHHLRRFQIRVKDSPTILLTDLYDATAHVLYELKGNSSRENVRMAIGQLFDYRRYVRPPNPALAILLPSEPHDDMKALLRDLDITLVYHDGATFVGVPRIAKTT